MRLSSLKQVVLLLLFLPLASFASDQADVLLKKGNNFYAKGQYQQALNVYKEILGAEYQSPVVYFNMGNASFKAGDIPSALLYFEKARKLAPNDEDIRFNIRLANTKTSDKIEEVPEFFLSRWWNSLLLSTSVKMWSLWSIVFVLIASGLLIVYFFAIATHIKKSAFYASLGCFVLGLFTIVLSAMQTAYFEQNRKAIIFTSPVAVKSAPAEQAKSVFVIHEGTTVNLAESNNGWVKISLANGNEGWIKLADLREI